MGVEIKSESKSPEKRENLNENLKVRFNKIFEEIGTANKPTEFINSNGEKILMYKEQINDFSNRHTTNLRKIYICKALDSSKPVSIDPVKNIKTKDGLLSYADGSYDSSNFSYDGSGKLIDTGMFQRMYHLTDVEVAARLVNFENTYNDYKNERLHAYEIQTNNDQNEADSIISNLESGNLIG